MLPPAFALVLIAPGVAQRWRQQILGLAERPSDQAALATRPICLLCCGKYLLAKNNSLLVEAGNQRKNAAIAAVLG